MYSINHSRRILKWSYEWYQEKDSKLSSDETSTLRSLIASLDEATRAGDKKESDRLARELEAFTRLKHRKTIFHYVKEIVTALLLALVIATVVRASWFELYEIPTGSMRPYFREQDHLTVSKLPFGINIPLVTGHFLFEPELVQRTSAVTFSGDKIRTLDETTRFLWIFPYKKRLIKRMVGKPGDSLYFYGGQIYGVDRDGHPIEELLNSPWLDKIDYIPFMTFNGETTKSGPNEATLNMMGKAIGKVSLNPFGDLNGEIWNGTEWAKDDINALKTPHNTIKTYSDWWGMRNYAMARLLTRSQLKDAADIDPSSIPEGVLYLELRHTPSLTYPKSSLTKSRYDNPLVTTQRSIIPLQQKDLDTLMSNMYTARFIVENEKGRRYSVEGTRYSPQDPSFPQVPNGSYEFYFGKGYEVGFGAITTPLPDNHPLYNHSPENVQRLFNLGIDMSTAYEPRTPQQPYFPHRYAYFRNGTLYTLGSPLLNKEDPTLTSFLEREDKREKQASKEKPYFAFKDYGPPPTPDFIRTFGVTVPDNHYFVLGDNHAMSADSRIFGFVPEQNLQGAPSLIIWPTGSRWGIPWQKPYPIFNTPRIIVWSIAAIVALVWFVFHRKRLWAPIKL